LKAGSLLVLITAALILSAALAGPLAAPSPAKCSECHSGPAPAGEYVLAMPLLELTLPPAAPPNRTVEVTLSVRHPGGYALGGPLATLRLEGPATLPPGENATKPLGRLGASGGTASVTWYVLTGSPAAGAAAGEGTFPDTPFMDAPAAIRARTVLARANLNFSAEFAHAVQGPAGSNSYVVGQSGQMIVRTVGLFTGKGAVTMPAGRRPGPGEQAFFHLEAFEMVRNITLTPSANLGGSVRLTPGSLPALSPGQRQFIGVDQQERGSKAMTVNNGRIEIAWENTTGARDSSFVTVRFAGDMPAAPAPGSGAVSMAGRATGILSLGLLAVSLALGSVRSGGARRQRAHCAVSWFLLGLAVYHGLVLALGPYGNVPWAGGMLLGYAGAVAMGASGANGAAQERIIRRAGEPAWLLVHRATIIVTVILVLAHALMLGTDLAPLRALAASAHWPWG